MAYTTIKKPSDYFNTVLYTGTGATQSITGVGFQPDFTWIKPRSIVDNHVAFDAVRGATKVLKVNLTNAESTVAQTLTSFNSDGFSIGSDGEVSGNNATYASWNWLANNTSGSANTDGSISSTVSANTTSGFSIVKWTGNGSNPSTVGHGLGAVPKMIITKRISGDTASWHTYHASIGNAHDIYLNGTNPKASDTSWNSTTPTSSVFTINGANVNVSGAPYIAYCFAEKQGFSKFSSYVGIASSDSNFVYLGFKPSFLLIKNADASATNWHIYDNKRLGYNVDNNVIQANTTSAELTNDDIDFLSNGFKLRRSTASNNGSGNTMIYMAFAEEPLVGDNPATAR